jgi:cytochrome c-type biogenesis protein CcmH/NrfF
VPSLHLGPLHPAEQALTLLLAFGPFVLLGVTVWLSRRRNARDKERENL